MKLHNCPYCESSELGVIDTFALHYQIGCTQCATMGPVGKTKEEAERAWNSLCAKLCTHCIHRAYGKAILRKLELVKHKKTIENADN